jgi:hypothetical protein
MSGLVLEQFRSLSSIDKEGGGCKSDLQTSPLARKRKICSSGCIILKLGVYSHVFTPSEDANEGEEYMAVYSKARFPLSIGIIGIAFLSLLLSSCPDILDELPDSGPQITLVYDTEEIIYDDTITLGSVETGNFEDATITIKNTGTKNLILSNTPPVDLSDSTNQFTVEQPPSSQIAPGSSSTFTVRFTPSSPGTKSTQVSIWSNDPYDSPFNFWLQGIGFRQ